MTTFHAPSLNHFRRTSPFGLATLVVIPLAVVVLATVLYVASTRHPAPGPDEQFFDSQAHSFTGADGGGHVGGTR